MPLLVRYFLYSLLCLLIFTDFDCRAFDSVESPLDVSEACERIDSMGLTGVEGLWEYPGDGIIVYIERDHVDKYKYNIHVVQSEDVRLRPGEMLGVLTESARSGVYRLSQYSEFKRGLLAGMTDCVATLSKDSESIIIEGLKVKMRVSASTIMPLFWNKLRLSLRINVNNPIENLPEGLRKIYPSYDDNGSSLTRPRIL